MKKIVHIFMMLMLMYVHRPVYGMKRPCIQSNQEGNDNHSPAIIQLSRGGHINIVTFLLKQPNSLIRIQAKDNEGNTALMTASMFGFTDIVELLLKRGADIDAKDNAGCTSLLRAAVNRNIQMVNFLLKHGADIDAKDNLGCVALLHAAVNENIEMVMLLLDQGADMNAKDDKGNTALLGASKFGFTDIVQLLLNRGASILPNNDGYSPLLFAIGNGHVDVVQFLLKRYKSSDIIVNNANETALMRASAIGNETIVRLLLNHGANRNLVNIEGKTAAVLAYENKKFGVLEILNKGSNPLWDLALLASEMQDKYNANKTKPNNAMVVTIQPKKEYLCLVSGCEKSYKHSGSLRRHIVANHKENT